MDNSKIEERHPKLPRILQLLQTVYRRIQQNGQTSLSTHRKEVRQQLGMGRQRTKSIRRAQDKAHNVTSTDTLQTWGTNKTRDRRLEICVLRNPIRTMRRREIETSGLPIKNNARRRMQLRHPQQEIIGHNSSTQGMETIHQRKPNTNPSSSRPEKLGNLHDDEGTKRTTGPMATLLKSIQLQNRILTRTRRWEARWSYYEIGRPTNDGRQKAHKECGNIAPQRTILGNT